ncbi:MAG: CocE/NonD family hydrolase [Pseudomonadota bacterium]
MSETLATLRAAWPMLSRALSSGQLFRPQCHLVDPDPDIQCDYDVAIPMSEGYTLTANIFRSKRRLASGETTPVIMCAHPYDNHEIPALKKTPLSGPPQQYRLIPQAGGWPKFSTLTSWESPDPNFWVPAGYALVNVNLPGYANSGGPASVISTHQGKCYREAIAWVGAQPWCDGGVGLCGVSYLAISQYHAAAAPTPDALPDALKCICPWEGVTDLYRDLACGGGVADTGFLDFWWHTEVKEPLNNSLAEYLKTEHAIPPQVLDAYPLIDAYWADKAVTLENITVPMLVCGSFSDHELHTMGSFRAYERASSTRKWVYTHRTGKWASFYSDDVKALTRDFMDHFLKGTDNRFASLPSVRLEVRSARDDIHDVRWETDWPLPSTDYRPLYLTDGELADTPQHTSGEISYSAKDESVAFDYVFDQDTELSGYMKLKLWVEVRPDARSDLQPDDMILCIYVDKRDRNGRSVRFNGSVGTTDDMVTRGYCRVSRRALDPETSTSWLPVPLGTREDKLSAGDIVPVEIALRPSSTFFAAGEGLRLIVAGHEIVRAPIFKKDTSANAGRHILRFGGEYDAHLLVPMVG